MKRNGNRPCVVTCTETRGQQLGWREVMHTAHSSMCEAGVRERQVLHGQPDGASRFLLHASRLLPLSGGVHSLHRPLSSDTSPPASLMGSGHSPPAPHSAGTPRALQSVRLQETTPALFLPLSARMCSGPGVVFPVPQPARCPPPPDTAAPGQQRPVRHQVPGSTGPPSEEPGCGRGSPWAPGIFPRSWP